MDPMQEYQDILTDIPPVVFDEDIESDYDETRQDFGGESGDA